MLRCITSLSGNKNLATIRTATCRCMYSTHLSGQALPIALGFLLISTAIAHGQTDKPRSDASSGAQSAICDGQRPGDQHALSTSSGNANAAKDEQGGATQLDSESTKRLHIPGVDDATEAASLLGTQCKRDRNHDAAEQWKPDASASATNQPIFPQPDSTVPVVSYSGGQLKIVPHGARLGQILEAIETSTGIALVVPQGSAEIQIFDDIGPAPEREALMKLLDGSHLNYVILSSSKDPQRIDQVILTAQTSIEVPGKPVSATASLAQQAAGPALYGGSGFSSEDSGQAMIAEPVVPNAANAIPANVNIQQAAAASGKTPGQVLDELQKKQLEQLDQAVQSTPQ
jgi:hypothetical protein